MPKIALPFLACLLAVAATSAGAQGAIWKWRDASGQIHVSDMAPPPGTPANNILQRPRGLPAPAPAAASAAASAPSGVDSALQKKKAAADKAAADKAAADKATLDEKNAAVRTSNCTAAKSQIATIQSGIRLTHVNPQGEREVMNDAQRASELQRAQDIASQNCGPAPATP